MAVLKSYQSYPWMLNLVTDSLHSSNLLLSENYNSKTYETGWNIFSEKSVSKFLKKNKKVLNFSFKKFQMPFDLKPQKDPIRSWTIKSENRRLMINGISIIQPQTLLKIKLKNF